VSIFSQFCLKYLGRDARNLLYWDIPKNDAKGGFSDKNNNARENCRLFGRSKSETRISTTGENGRGRAARQDDRKFSDKDDKDDSHARIRAR